ncbi:MAG: holo-[acyl-carrier-protein] synthase [Puniceicoccaceae bacterium]|nr:MAG: holo-[acyl-carrier-protein] synthase [Puniceicoccaceae bacterium]
MQPPDFPEGTAVLGLGLDLIEVERIRGVWDRQGDRFLNRIFTREELDYCLGMKHPHKHLAARFAAKEAVSKAFGTGIGGAFGWTSASIYHAPGGRPLVRLDERGADLLRRLGGRSVLLSLSHTEGHAAAVAVITA